MEDNSKTESQSPSLGVQDLMLMYQVIQVVSQRGAFRADEMTNVGGLHDRLKAFLVSAGAIRQAESSAPDNEDPKE